MNTIFDTNMTSPKKYFIAAAIPMLLLCLCFAGLPGTIGTASADRFSGKDDQAVIDFCKKALGSKTSQLEIGACYQGYIFGYDGYDKAKCNDTYNNSDAIRSCRDEGYNGGVKNSAPVTRPPRQGGGGGAGAGGTAGQCGEGDGIKTSINIGCRGEGNPLADMAFAIIRVLSAGVGLVIVGSIVVGGIQYSASRGDPQATALAIGRIRSSLIALIIFIFAYAILNFIIPAGFL